MAEKIAETGVAPEDKDYSPPPAISHKLRSILSQLHVICPSAIGEADKFICWLVIVADDVLYGIL